MIQGPRTTVKTKDTDMEHLKSKPFEELLNRVEDLENFKTPLIPITPLKPNASLAEVTKNLNYVIAYINMGVKYGEAR